MAMVRHLASWERGSEYVHLEALRVELCSVVMGSFVAFSC